MQVVLALDEYSCQMETLYSIHFQSVDRNRATLRTDRERNISGCPLLQEVSLLHLGQTSESWKWSQAFAINICKTTSVSTNETPKHATKTTSLWSWCEVQARIRHSYRRCLKQSKPSRYGTRHWTNNGQHGPFHCSKSVSLPRFQAQTANELNELHSMILKGWPHTRRETSHSIIREYYGFRDELAVSDGIVHKGMNIVLGSTSPRPKLP